MRITQTTYADCHRFRDPAQAREALEKMNGFDLAGRPIRVGLGNDKFTPESTASLLQRFQGQSHQQQFQGSSFSPNTTYRELTFPNNDAAGAKMKGLLAATAAPMTASDRTNSQKPAQLEA